MPTARFRTPRTLLAGLILSLVVSCVGWKEIPPQPDRSFGFDSTQTYRLILKSGDTVVAANPRVAGDSVVWGDQDHHAVPAAQIRTVARQKADFFTPLSALAVVGILIVALTLGGQSVHY